MNLRNKLRYVKYLIKNPCTTLDYSKSRVSGKHHIFLACMPKSGSTFMSDIIGSLPEFSKVDLVQWYGRVEQNLDEPTIRKIDHCNYIGQHHVCYNDNTRTLMATYNLKAVVLVRNIFDIVISLRDHLRRESTYCSMAWIDEEHLKMTDRELESMIVDLVIPWYINFYNTWLDCDNCILISYEELIKNTTNVISRVMNYCGATSQEAKISEILAQHNPKKSRFNVGISQRGNALPEHLKNNIRRYCSYYPNTNFSILGIEQ